MNIRAVLAGLILVGSGASGARAWDGFSGLDTGIRCRRFVVVRDQAQWSSLWAEHSAGAARPAPAVDFSREMVVAVFLGERPSGGTRVELEVLPDPMEPRSRLTVFYKEIRARGMAFMQRLVHPFAMRKVPRAAQVRFEKNGEVGIPEKAFVAPSVLTPEKVRLIESRLRDPSSWSGF